MLPPESSLRTRPLVSSDYLSKMVAVKSILAVVLAITGPASADRLFYNSGTLSGWDGSRHENKGTLSEVTNISYKTGTALKMTQTYDPGYKGRYHSEVDHNDGYSRGDERFYGFMFRVSQDWEFVSQNLNIAQFIAHRPGGNNCGDLDMPSTMIWIAGKQLHSRLVQGAYNGGNCQRNFVDLPNLGEIVPGKWHKIIIQAKWEDNDTGYFKLWFDGKKSVEKYGLKTTVGGDWRFQYRGM